MRRLPGFAHAPATAAFLAELGLQPSGPRPDQGGDDPASQICRAGLTHPVLHRMLAKAEELAPMLRLSRALVFGLLRDLVIEEVERSPHGLVARNPAPEAARGPRRSGAMGFEEFLAEAAKVIDGYRCRPRAPEWAVTLGSDHYVHRWRR